MPLADCEEMAHLWNSPHLKDPRHFPLCPELNRLGVKKPQLPQQEPWPKIPFFVHPFGQHCPQPWGRAFSKCCSPQWLLGCFLEWPARDAAGMDKHLGSTPEGCGKLPWSPGRSSPGHSRALGCVTSQGTGGAGQLGPSGAVPAKKRSGTTTCELCPGRSLEVNN